MEHQLAHKHETSPGYEGAFRGDTDGGQSRPSVPGTAANAAHNLDAGSPAASRGPRESAQVMEGKEHRNCFLWIYDKLIELLHIVVPTGGILSGAFNMASASIGAGILGLPSAANHAGLILALIFLAIITFFSVFSMYIIAVAVCKTQIRSYEGMARLLFPRGRYAFSYWSAFIRWFHGFSGCVAYVISIGDCFDPIFAEAARRSPNNKGIKFFNTTWGNRVLVIIIWGCIMLPLLIPKHVDSLRYASTLAVVFIMYFCLVLIIHGITHGMDNLSSRVRFDDRDSEKESDKKIYYLFRTGNILLSSVGVFMFAYVCQINAYEVWWDMRTELRTPRNFTWSALIGMLITGVIYSLVSLFGYFDFGSLIGGKSVLKMYNPLSEPEMLVAYIGIMFKLCVAYALLGSAARNSIYYLIGWQQRYSTKGPDALEQRQAEKLTDVPVLEENGGNAGCVPAQGTQDLSEGDDVAYVDNIPFLKHLTVVVLLSLATLLCGLFIPNINTVFGFAGAISGGFLAFILPALFYIYSGNFTVKTEGWFSFYVTYLLLICGVIGIVFGLAGTIYSTLSG